MLQNREAWGGTASPPTRAITKDCGRTMQTAVLALPETRTSYLMSWTAMASAPVTGPAPTGPVVMYRTNQPAMQLELPLPRIGVTGVPYVGLVPAWQSELFLLFESDM